MQYIKSLTVEHFKIFGEKITINFDDTTTLIGPNNAGKTTIIQSLTLWQKAIRAFYDNKTTTDPKTKKRIVKGKLNEGTGIGINRLDIDQIPNTDTRQLFHKSQVRDGKDNKKIEITLAIYDTKNEVKNCSVTFKYFKSEIIYCYLSKELSEDPDLLEKAAKLNINLLYPMSGLAKEETVLQPGNIKKQLGSGITAGLLRNICYNVFTENEEDWNELKTWMHKLFYIRLEDPKRFANDDLVLWYNYAQKDIETEKSLDILQAGRGQLQMLLILAFAFWQKNAILLIDEPDAHLEVLRQNQMIEVLKIILSKQKSQLIIATHSEVLMNESPSLRFLFNGKHIELDENKNKVLKNSLKDFGIEHYYRAELTKSVLYLEGTTDKQNLQTIAEHLNHPLKDVLGDKIFTYYTQSPDPLHKEYEMQAGYYALYKKHFQTLKPLVEDLRGIAIFDSDGTERQNEINENGLTTLYWKKYELENYFINPESVAVFARNHFIDSKGELFSQIDENKFKEFFERHFLLPIFGDDETVLGVYKKSNKEEQNALYNSSSKNKKVSLFLEETFQQFAKNTNTEIILRKSEFYKLIAFCDAKTIDKEVLDVLNQLNAVLSTN